MRTARILGTGASSYHVMSRVVDGQFIFDETEKDIFRGIMRRLSAFSGVEVFTYAIMSNHFHILVHVPERNDEISDEELGERLGAIYRPARVRAILARIRKHRAEGRDDLAEAVRRPFLERMYNLACYVKELKQRFSQGYNDRHQRRGTLWEERFKSVLVQDDSRILLVVAAYIDLNPVRAGICEEPAHYRFCGYGEAIGGGLHARQGLHRLLARVASPVRIKDVLGHYRRCLVRDCGSPPGGKPKADRPAVLSQAEVLRCRVRYFTDSAALGSRLFIDEVFRRYRSHFGARRKSGALPMQGADWQGMCALRDLRGDVIG